MSFIRFEDELLISSFVGGTSFTNIRIKHKNWIVVMMEDLILDPIGGKFT